MTGRVYTAAERRALIDVARVAALLLRETVPALAPVTDFSRWLDYAVRGEPFPNNAVDRAHVGSRSNTLMAIHVIDEAIQWVVRGNAREATTCAQMILGRRQRTGRVPRPAAGLSRRRVEGADRRGPRGAHPPMPRGCGADEGG